MKLTQEQVDNINEFFFFDMEPTLVTGTRSVNELGIKPLCDACGQRADVVVTLDDNPAWFEEEEEEAEATQTFICGTCLQNMIAMIEKKQKEPCI